MNNSFYLPKYEIRSLQINKYDDIDHQILILYSEFMMVQAIVENFLKVSYYAFKIYMKNNNIKLQQLKKDSEELFKNKSTEAFSVFLNNMSQDKHISMLINCDIKNFTQIGRDLLVFRNSIAHISNSKKFMASHSDDSNLAIASILCTNFTSHKFIFKEKLQNNLNGWLNLLDMVDYSLVFSISNIGELLIYNSGSNNYQIIIKASNDSDDEHFNKFIAKQVTKK